MQSQKETPSVPSDEMSDEFLMHAIACGAGWAMEPLYQRYRRLLYSLVYHMVVDHQVAEDLLQDAFLSVWRRAASYSPLSGAVRSWLVSIVHHRAIDHLRWVQRRSTLQSVALSNAEEDEHTTLPDVWEEAWQAEMQAQVREALMKLPEKQRLLLGLAYFRGWTHTESAEKCHLPLGTVKSRMRLGLLHLRRALDQVEVGVM